MTVTEQEMRALTYLATRCRPTHSPHKDWDEQGVMANLRKLANHSLPEVILATIRAAANPAAQTPGVIPKLDGEHWRDTPHQASPPTGRIVCGEHLLQHHGTCPSCEADRKATAAEHAPKPAPPANTTNHSAWATKCHTNLKGQPPMKSDWYPTDGDPT